MQEIAEEEAAKNSATFLTLLSQINRAYHLAESLRETAQRRWWDLLAFRIALSRELAVTGELPSV